MANRKVYVILLYMFAFNLLTAGINEMGIWDGQMEHVNLDRNVQQMNASIREISSTSDIEETDTSGLSLLEIPGMLVKAFALVALSLVAIPLVGGLLYAYGMPLAICGIFQAFNILLLAYVYIEFTSNRSASR